MTKDELKRKQYDTWNRYYQKHKSEINARRKKVREDYKNKLSIADKRIAELEAQIEKMKCCYNCKHSRTEYEHCRTDKHEKWEIKEK